MLAVLHQKPDGSRAYKTYLVKLHQQNKDIVPVIDNVPVDNGASMLVALEAPWSGSLVFGEQSIVYLGPAPSAMQSAKVNLPPGTVITACCRLNGRSEQITNSCAFLIGDMDGRLHQITLSVKKNVYTMEIVSGSVGSTISIASSLTALDSERIFVGSRFDDSLLVKTNNILSNVKVLDVLPNVGPIIDFALADVDNSGQSQIVTCSGAYKNGSLRVIRSGVGVEQLATIEISGVKDIFPLKGSQSLDLYQRYLLLSFYDSSTLLIEENGDFEQADPDSFPFIQDEPTLLCTNLQDELILQV